MSEDLEERLYGVLANRQWSHDVALGIFDAAAEALDRLTDDDWLEAIKAHPPIGERGGPASQREQARAMQASPERLATLAAENRMYEEKFGHVFLIAAEGRTAEEILAELRRRMNNDAMAEFEEAKRELRRIVSLRLERL